MLALSGDLDTLGAAELRAAVMAAVADGERLLVLDLCDVDFIDSVGLGAVVGALKRTRQRAGDLGLVCPVPRVRRVFEMCDLDQVMPIGATIHELLGNEVPGDQSPGAPATSSPAGLS